MHICFAEVVQKVMNDPEPYCPEIPPVNPADNNGKLMILMTECWANDPLNRPTGNEIKRKLRAMNKGK